MMKSILIALALFCAAPPHAIARDKPLPPNPPGLHELTQWCEREIARRPNSADAKMCVKVFLDVYGTETPGQE